MQIKRVSSWALPIIFIGILAYVLGYSSLLTVKELDFNDVAKNSEVLSKISNPSFNLSVGDKLARIDVRGAERAITSIGWVSGARISRNWFTGKVSVVATARTPVASISVNSAGALSYIDSQGFIYSSQNAIQNLPTITIGDAKLAQEAAQFITKFPRELLSNMRNLNLSNAGDFEMQENLDGRAILIRWGDSNDLATKLEIYQKLISLPENSSISLIDLSDPKYPIVKNK